MFFMFDYSVGNVHPAAKILVKTVPWWTQPYGISPVAKILLDLATMTAGISCHSVFPDANHKYVVARQSCCTGHRLVSLREKRVNSNQVYKNICQYIIIKDGHSLMIPANSLLCSSSRNIKEFQRDLRFRHSQTVLLTIPPKSVLY